MAKNENKVSQDVNQSKPENVNKSVDSTNPAEPKFQPSQPQPRQNSPFRGQADKTRGVSGADPVRVEARKAELESQPVQNRLHTSAPEVAKQQVEPGDGAQTADSVNLQEANALPAFVQPTATNVERKRAEKQFEDAQRQAKNKDMSATRLSTMSTSEKDAVSAESGLEPAAAVTPAESVSTDTEQGSNKGTRKLL